MENLIEIPIRLIFFLMGNALIALAITAIYIGCQKLFYKQKPEIPLTNEEIKELIMHNLNNK